MDDFDMPADDTDASAEDERVFEGEQLGIFNDVSSLVNCKVRETDMGWTLENCYTLSKAQRPLQTTEGGSVRPRYGWTIGRTSSHPLCRRTQNL